MGPLAGFAIDRGIGSSIGARPRLADGGFDGEVGVTDGGQARGIAVGPEDLPEGVELTQVESPPRAQHGCDHPGPAGYVRQPRKNSCRCHHKIELLIQEARSVVDISFQEPRHQPALVGEVTRQVDRFRTEIDPGNLGPQAAPGEGVHPEMTLQVEQADPLDSPDGLQVKARKGNAATPEILHPVERGFEVERGPGVPGPAVDLKAWMGLVIARHGMSIPMHHSLRQAEVFPEPPFSWKRGSAGDPPNPPPIPMKSPYRVPPQEEGKHNLVFQNRCGNRLSWIVHATHTELETSYKPNAFRRTDFRARNFSCRDIFTSLFADLRLPDLGTGLNYRFNWDPFHTTIEVNHPDGALNRIQVLNLASHNAFVLTARAPMLLALRPHAAFRVEDGLLWEPFSDRGEDIVSFVLFRGYESSRYRVLEDGTHLLQVVENDPLIIGGEENRAQVDAIRASLRGLSMAHLAAANEIQVRDHLREGQACLADPAYQRVFDLNRRIAWSGIDAGGACFGAINRIYHLIWVRDGSMTAAHMALAGCPQFSRLWTPFLLANPSVTMSDDGDGAETYGQLLGTRWSKSEDDGLFYAVWTLFTYFRVTGDDGPLQGEGLSRLIRIARNHLERCLDQARGIMTSDTLGEESLRGSPYFGYDIVDGSFKKAHSNVSMEGRPFLRVASFYHQVNTFNACRMLECLAATGDLPDRSEACAYLRGQADLLQHSLRTHFVSDDGTPYALWAFFTDGTDQKYLVGAAQTDFWETSWAMAQGPFFPLPESQLQGARLILEQWPQREGRSYGLCPWNVLLRFLHTRGSLSSVEVRHALEEEVAEALSETERYPMAGALHEDHRNPHHLRGLPFSAGSFTVAQTSLLLSPLAQGLALRDGGGTRSLKSFRYRLSRIDARVTGEGPQVLGWSLNGVPVPGTLQIPEARLRPGANTIEVTTGEREGEKRDPRLWASDAELHQVSRSAPAGTSVWEMASAVPALLEVEGLEPLHVVEALDQSGRAIPHNCFPDPASGRTCISVGCSGVFLVRIHPA